MEHSENFKKALKFTLRWEGSYVNNPYDRGGPTNRGITQGVYTAYRLNKHQTPKHIRHISSYEVKDIYHIKYWNLAGCSKLDPKLAIAVFDFSVNSGVPRALRYLKLVKGDLDKYLDKREEFFRIIGRGTQKRFLKGWLNRLKALREYLEG